MPMAASLLALLDDIASVLDDVSVMTKVAAKKTAGVLGDDLALAALDRGTTKVLAGIVAELTSTCMYCAVSSPLL